jgi:hypothetical protein
MIKLSKNRKKPQHFSILTEIRSLLPTGSKNCHKVCLHK